MSRSWPAQARPPLLLIPALALALAWGGAALLPAAPLWAQAPPAQLKAAKGAPGEIKERKDTQKRLGGSAIRESKEAEPEGKKIDDGKAKKAKKSAPGRYGAQTIRSLDSPEQSPDR